MSENKKDALLTAFNNAVNNFWIGASDMKKEGESLADLVNDVYLARDELGAADLHDKEWDSVIQDVADIGEYVAKHEIPIMGTPQMTSTGKKTYKILQPRRFDL